MRSLIALVLFFVASHAHAAYTYAGSPTYYTAGGYPASTMLASCSLRVTDLGTWSGANVQAVNSTQSQGQCWGLNANGDPGTVGSIAGTCEAYAGSAFVAPVGGCYVTVAQCPPGEEPDANQVCAAPNPCQPGQVGTQNFTIGWSNRSALEARSLSESAFMATFASPPSAPAGSACVGSCSVTVSGSGSAFWHAYDPAPNGLYRVSADYTTTNTGATCSTPTESADPEAPPMPCPGYLGTVNGTPVCLPATTSDEAAAQPYLIGNPAAGSNGADSIGERNGGTGGNAGGPPSASDGDVRGGGGTVSGGGGAGEGEPDGECGFGSNPPCKIDESGTPSPVPSNAHDGLADGVQQAELGAIGAATSAVPSTQWSWSFQLPTGCAPLTLSAWAVHGWDGVINVCAYQGTIHDLMSMVWIAAAIFGCVSLVGRTLGA